MLLSLKSFKTYLLKLLSKYIDHLSRALAGLNHSFEVVLGRVLQTILLRLMLCDSIDA